MYRQAAEAVVGATVSAVPTLDPRYARGAPTAVVIDALRGATIEAVRRIGKLLLLDTDRAVVGVRFGMTGRLLIDGIGPIDALEYGPTSDDRRWDRLVLRFADGRLFTVNDSRRFGRIEIDPDEGSLGPEAGSVTVARLRGALGTSRAALKSRLLDQRRLAGLGNLLADESLWRAGLDPRRPAGGLADDEQRRLARTIRSTIGELTVRGGSHTGDLQPERRPDGRCPRDGGPLQLETVAGRTTCWCPTHQR